MNASRSRLGWLLALLSAGIVVALLIAGAACGGGDDDDDNNGGDEATPAATHSADGNGADEETPDADHEDGGGDNGGDEDAAAELASLSDKYERFEGYVKYSGIDFSGGESTLNSMSLYQKGDKSRTDIESSDGNVILINTPEATYVCSEDQCLKYPVDAGDAGSVADAFTGFLNTGTSGFEDLPEGVDVNVSDETIAGIDGKCFSASGDLDEDIPGDESGEVCFSESGLLLRLNYQSGDDSGTFEAVEADDEVPDSAFDPPFEVIDISNLNPNQ